MHEVIVTDHDFADLSIEREVLDGVADVRSLADEPGVADEAIPPEADALLVLRRPIPPDDVAGSDLRIVARYGIGVDGIAVEEATERGVYVTNVPDYCVEEVSTHALAMLLSLLRGLPVYGASIADGEWDRSSGPPLHRLSTLTVGVVGFGDIGRAVGETLDALGADVLASDPYLAQDDVGAVADLVAFDELVARADAVTIHSPLTDDTRGLFDEATFERMQDSAVLVNVARGPIVDDDALLAALDAGEIAGAGLDVFPDEPPRRDHPLRDHERVVVTPHVAWYSEEANRERRRRAAENVRSVLEGGVPADAVNDP